MKFFDEKLADNLKVLRLHGLDKDAWKKWWDHEKANYGKPKVDDEGKMVDKDGDHPRIKVMRHGRPKLGVQLVQVTPELREHLGSTAEAGVLVSKVLPGTPAEDGGILVGDLIVAVDGESIEGTAALVHALTDKDNQTIEVEVIRDGRSRRFDVVIPAADED